jgi:phosphoribosylformylglycinamidine synthase
MRQYSGINALPAFKQTKLLQQLQKIDRSVSSVTAEFIHFVDSAKELSDKEDQQLQTLLTYDSPYKDSRQGELFLVVPRLGTISPWSSKATDIAHNAGLNRVNRIERGTAYYIHTKKKLPRARVEKLLHDRMTETVLSSTAAAAELFTQAQPKPLKTVDVLQGGREALLQANLDWGLAINAEEIDYLVAAYNELGRNPTDAELMMFGVVNSEHCRHKIFNADWTVNGQKQPKSLFQMIRNTYQQGGEDVLSAYTDNAAVFTGPKVTRFWPDTATGTYGAHYEPANLVVKAETHNHPTAISPFPGASTGNGGEIRDEGATGRGAKPKMGLSGFHTSNLNLADLPQPWESAPAKPDRIVSPLEVMIDGPLGGASFNNEFGRPNLVGYFRTYEQSSGKKNQSWGYHKPIMIAGGLGNIRQKNVLKKQLPVGAIIIVLGGPNMLIGLGGGSASSLQTGTSHENLDFASVQRGNGEMQRRAQEVINACASLDDNPIISIHDVGAGGMSNALPELVHDSNRGARFELRALPNADLGMSPMEIWCNESQERYVLGLEAKDLERFKQMCERERCPYAVVGETTDDNQLVVHDELFDTNVIDLPMDVLFGKPPKMSRGFERTNSSLPALSSNRIKIDEAVKRVLQLPAVGSKKFLITIGDRTVGGLSVRDQMVGPWQVPVSDLAVTSSSFGTSQGEAMAMGERTPLAIINSPAAARMAVGEAITNIAAACIDKLHDVKLSANWMAAAGTGHEDEKLYEAVKAIGEEFCPALGVTIPVGKDSLSMRTVWEDQTGEHSVTSPVSLIISAFSPVIDVTKTLTPQLTIDETSQLLLIDLGLGRHRLGGSAVAQVYNQIGNEAPDISPLLLKSYFNVIQKLNREGMLLAYHDRSDGGLVATLSEMAFASRCGLDIDLAAVPGEDLERLFNEELGCVVQVSREKLATVKAVLSETVGDIVYDLGHPTLDQTVTFRDADRLVYQNSRVQLEEWWSLTSKTIQALRDNPACAEEEYAAISNPRDTGLAMYAPPAPAAPTFTSRPKVAILREEGVNGQVEMAAAFDRAGFTCVDVHLQDLVSGRFDLQDFVGLVACGGFSYGDVLGAGEGWAKSILFNKKLSAAFKKFFTRKDTFSLGVCNGCQMLAALKSLVPGADHWPSLLRNTSQQFEARLVAVKVNESPSIFFKDLTGSQLLVPTAHGEGRMGFDEPTAQQLVSEAIAPLQYVDYTGQPTTSYPANPNGSPLGVAALTSRDGRATIIMPHPERVFLTQQLSWHPPTDSIETPWMEMFYNARRWVS